MTRFANKLVQFGLLGSLLIVWELLSRNSRSVRFLFGSPLLVVEQLYRTPLEWLSDTAITGAEALIGFILGLLIGSLLGFALLFSKSIASIARPYVIAIGSIPVLAVAPILIIWFGVGYPMKIASAFFATVLVALSQAFEGGRNIDPGLIEWFGMYRHSRRDLFRKLILPSSIDWVFASMKLNIGFALLGAFLGEFIASDSGLGNEILSAGGVYDFPRVFAATVCIIVLALFLNSLVSLLEKYKYKLIDLLSVPRSIRDFESRIDKG